jgi:hypothetical protein
LQRQAGHRWNISVRRELFVGALLRLSVFFVSSQGIFTGFLTLPSNMNRWHSLLDWADWADWLIG